MSKAYIIEIHDRTAGIITSDERGFRFFSSERAFDSLDGRAVPLGRARPNAPRVRCWSGRQRRYEFPTRRATERLDQAERTARMTHDDN